MKIANFLSSHHIPPHKIKAVFAINIIVARNSSDIETIRMRFLKSFKKFTLSACSNDIVILTRVNAGNSSTLKIHEYIDPPKAVCSDFSGTTIWARGHDGERIFESLQHFIPSGCRKSCCAYYDANQRIQEYTFLEKIRRNMSVELNEREIVLCTRVARYEEEVGDYMIFLRTDGEYDQEYEENSQIRDRHNVIRPGRVRLDRAGQAVSFIDVNRSILRDRNPPETRPSASSTLRDKTGVPDITSQTINMGDDATYNPDNTLNDSDDDDDSRQTEPSRVTTKEVNDIVNETVGELRTEIRTHRQTDREDREKDKRELMERVDLMRASLMGVFSGLGINPGVALSRSSNMPETPASGASSNPSVAMPLGGPAASNSTNMASGTGAPTTAASARTSASMMSAIRPDNALAVNSLIDQHNRARDMATGNGGQPTNRANYEGSMTSSVDSAEPIDLSERPAENNLPEIPEVEVETIASGASQATTSTSTTSSTGTSTMTSTVTQMPRLATAEEASRSSAFTSTPHGQRRVQFNADITQVDGGVSPDSLDTVDQDIIEVSNPDGRFALNDTDASEEVDIPPATGLTDPPIIEPGEHHSVHLVGDLTFLMAGLSGQNDLAFRWTSITDYRLFTTDSRLFILIENKAQDDTLPPFYEFPEAHENGLLMHTVLKSVMILTRSQALERFGSTPPVYRVILNDTRFPLAEDCMELRYFSNSMVISAAYSNRFIGELLDMSETTPRTRLISENMPERVTETLTPLFQNDGAREYKVNFAKMIIKIAHIIELFHFDAGWSTFGNHIFSSSNITRKVEVRPYDQDMESLRRHDEGGGGIVMTGGQSYHDDGFGSSHLNLGRDLEARVGMRQQINEGLDESRPQRFRNEPRNVIGAGLGGAYNVLENIISTPLNYLGNLTGLSQQETREDTPFPITATAGATVAVTTVPPVTSEAS